MSRTEPRLGRGHRLADPHDHAVRDALTRACPVCTAEPSQWCIGVDTREGSRTLGRRLTRIHAPRCTFAEGLGNGRRAKAAAR